jgi:hypothetical protein
MDRNSRALLGIGLLLGLAIALAQSPGDMSVRTSLCEILRQPQRYNGKLVEFRAIVEPGLEDLPAGAADPHCTAELKFLSPDDPHLAKLLKSGEFKKLVRLLRKKPVVEATIAGQFHVSGKRYGLLLESVAHVKALVRK